jgi:hypothetical protein
MTDRTQFEAMLEALINEDQETAKEIFHNIVVAKSREIYEELLESDFNAEEQIDELAAETPDGDVPLPEESEEEEEGADDEEGEMDFGGDEEGEGDSEEELEDRVLDLEDALEELKAEFEELMAGEEGEEHGDEFGGDDMGGMDDMGDDMGGADMEFDEEGDEMPVFEYVNKVSPPKHGDNGVNTKSIVAGKNDMGGTTANMVKGGVAKGEGTKGGLADPSTKDLNSGNVNVPGAKSATKLSSVGKGHGAEKKGTGEHADNKRSIVGGK